MKELLMGWDYISYGSGCRSQKIYGSRAGGGMERRRYEGSVIKCHYADTTGPGCNASFAFPGTKVYGGLVLNRQAGGLNPDAAERMAQAGGKYLWFPTMDS